ncbi:MAG: hypothetical protein R3B48_28795 [Kofleriaceae bacterium]
MEPRRLFGQRGALLGAALILVAVASCTASSDEVRPPKDQFFFPTGLALDPTQATLFVANANSELRYDSGVISAVDLAAVDEVADAWSTSKTIPAGCSQDLMQPETLVCNEATFIKSAVRIGNFASGISVQSLGNGRVRLIVPVRGDPSITWMDWDGSSLSCEDGAEGFSQCDDRRRLIVVRGDEDVGIPQEPFRTYVDSINHFAVVTHLSSGTVTLLDSPTDGDPIVADVLGGLFLSNGGLPGGSAIVGRNPLRDNDNDGMADPLPPQDPGENHDLLYVGSRTEDRVQMLTVDRPADGGLPYLVSSNYFFLDAAGGNNGGSSVTSGMAFTDDGKHLLVVNQRPPTLQIYDTTMAPDGFPRNDTVSVVDICREAAGLAVADVGYGPLAVIPCFRDGTMYIADATGRRPTEALLTVGRGPFDVAISTTRQKAYVTNFLEDSVGVVELAPGTNQYREVLRIGETRL